MNGPPGRKASVGWNAWAAVAVLSSGCAVSNPVLVEPRITEVGDVRATVGGAGFAPIGGDRTALADARAALSSNSGKESVAESGAAVALAAPPGVAPIVRAAVAVVPDKVEATLRYSGRDVDLGGRYVFFASRTENASATTLSIGLDGRALLLNRPDEGLLPGSYFEGVHGYGASAPLIAAWQSDAGLVLAYLATTIGYDRIGARVAFPTAGDLSSTERLRLRETTVSRVWGAATVGLGVGFRRVHVIFELGLERDLIHATLNESARDVRLWSLAPAFALSTRF